MLPEVKDLDLFYFVRGSGSGSRLDPGKAEKREKKFENRVYFLYWFFNLTLSIV
jgi:hypothetical protein